MAPVDFPRDMPQDTGTGFHKAGEGVAGPAQTDNNVGGQPQNQASNTIPYGNSNREAGDSQSGLLPHMPSRYDAPYAHPGRSQMSIPNSSGQQNFPRPVFGPPLPPAAVPGAARSMEASQSYPGPQPYRAPENLSSSNTSRTSSDRPGVTSSTRPEHLEEGQRPKNNGKDGKPKPWEGMEGLAALDDLAGFGDFE